MMATQSNLQDCYFYFYSSCTKGDECPFRHCELALGTETVCSLWREGRCFRSNCKFRHMESRINRSMIPCYWENQPGGCRKPHCVFLHRKSRNCVQVIKDTPGLILPTSDGKTSPKHTDLNEIPFMPNKVSLPEEVAMSDVVPDPSLAPVPPLVLSFDEGEESDTESITSTPVKQSDKKAVLKNNLSVKSSGTAEEKDFGIKTLEQIRMEKIHKESDSYYGAAYASTPLDVPRLIEQHYPPKADFLALPKDSSVDKSSPAPVIETKLSGVDEETDLRGRLNRRNAPSNKVNQVKRLISFKKLNGNQVEAVDSSKLDFKIKTLEEIRKEKENKQSKYDEALDNLPSLEGKRSLNSTKQKTLRKLKINRKPKTLNSVTADLKPDVVAPSMAEKTANNLVSNGVKEMSSESTSEEPSEVPIWNKNPSSSSPGKRKSDDDSCTTASKIIKILIPSNDDCELVNKVNAYPDSTDEKNLAQSCLLHPEIKSSTVNEASDISSHIHTSTLPSPIQDMVSQSSVPDIEMNGVTSDPTSTSLPSPCCKPDEESNQASEENEHTSKDEIPNTNVNSTVLPVCDKSDPSSDSAVKKDNLIDRSMSVDAELDELLGDDDMNMDEIDATPNDDILLEIEEFLES